MQIPSSYGPLRQWVFQKEMEERTKDVERIKSARRAVAPPHFSHACEKRQDKSTLTRIAPGTGTRHEETTTNKVRQCCRIQSLRGRRLTYIFAASMHLSWPALRDPIRSFSHLQPVGARPPTSRFRAPADSLACTNRRTRAILRFSQNTAVVFGGPTLPRPSTF